MSKTKTEKTEQKITIDDVDYLVADLTEEQVTLVNHVSDLDRKLTTSKFNIDQLTVGRDAFMTMLTTSLAVEEEQEKHVAGYIGRAPISAAVQNRKNFTATASQTTFSMAYQPGFLDVYMNGVKLKDTTDYAATNGADIVLTSGVVVNTEIEGVSFGNYDLITTLRQFPFFKTDGTSDPINITNSKFPFFIANGTASDIGVT